MKHHEPQQLPDQPRTIMRGGGRVWIHAFTTKGRFTNLRNYVAAVLLIVFYATPWVTWGGAPLLKLSFLKSSFIILGQPVLIYEFHHFVLLALLLVLTLIIASTLYGRVWCGYACPQTIFIEQVLGRIETLFEGPAARRLANKAKPMTDSRLARKIGKQAAFALVSLTFAFTLVAVFTGTDLLLVGQARSAWTAVLLLTAVAWFDGGYWREQFCHIVCPYGRLQGMMQDGATRTIGYDEVRGEPRRGCKQREGAGDCIDCGLCVRVCPSGIDIRQGPHQLECIGCARCVDACDGVMKNVGKSPGLIRYDAVAMFAAKPGTERPKLWRPRSIGYVLIWLALAAFGVGLFVTRVPFIAKVLSTSGSAPYFIDAGRLKNLYMIKIGNQGRDKDSYRLKLSSPTIADLKIETPVLIGPLAAGQEGALPVLVSGDLKAVGSVYQINIIAEHSSSSQTVDRKMIGPAKP